MNTEKAREEASELVGWLETMRRGPDVDHEMLHCIEQAIKRARSLERFITRHWLDGCPKTLTAHLRQPSPGTTPQGGRR